uniref:Uncharacterized protein n=1 Tax=Theropithecus gelada TaxID=9565 RepID=A0A8D2FLR1_THEGE
MDVILVPQELFSSDQNHFHISPENMQRPPILGNRVWFIHDDCGMICADVTWLLVIYADFVVTFIMLLASKAFWYSVVNGVIFNYLATFALLSHLRTMLTDPGAVPRGNATKEYMESLQLKPREVIYKCPQVLLYQTRAHPPQQYLQKTY